jgi:hypothetical protein
VLPARPTGAEGFPVLRIEPERALVLAGASSSSAAPPSLPHGRAAAARSGPVSNETPMPKWR